jgi:uncharacterized membrane protein YgcG
MYRFLLRISRTLVASLFLLVVPAMVLAQVDQVKTGSPPVSQPLVNEGEFALTLHSALTGSTADDEVSAESALGELGIAPRNGWIADYPVTPDIIVELQTAVEAAATAGKLSVSAAEAIEKLREVTASYGLTVRQYTSDTPYEPSAESCVNYPNPAMVKENYTREGSPVVSYYCPPPEYYSMYAWVPAPFWWSDLWFPGFFILHDFHRVVHVHKRVVVITNHFNDRRSNRAFRIDPVNRHHGRTFAGIGVTRPRDFMSTGVPRSERTIFNAPRVQRSPGGTGGPMRERVSPPARGGERSSPMLRGDGQRGGRGSSGGGGGGGGSGRR